MSLQSVPVLGLFELGFARGSATDELKHSLYPEALGRHYPFAFFCPLDQVAYQLGRLGEGGFIGVESGIGDELVSIAETWAQFWIQMQGKWSAGGVPNEDDKQFAHQRVAAVEDLGQEIDELVQGLSAPSDRWYRLGKTLGQGKFLEEDLEEWLDEVVERIQEVDPDQEWSDEALSKIQEQDELDTSISTKALVSELCQEVRGGIGMVKQKMEFPLVETSKEAIESWQQAGRRFEQALQNLQLLLDKPVITLPRAEELGAELGLRKKALYIGETRVDFASGARYAVAEKLILAGEPVLEFGLTGSALDSNADDRLPDEDTDIPSLMTRIRDDLGKAALQELKRILEESIGAGNIDEDLQARLEEEAGRVRAALPKAVREPRKAGRTAVARAYQWDAGVLSVNVMG